MKQYVHLARFKMMIEFVKPCVFGVLFCTIYYPTPLLTDYIMCNTSLLIFVYQLPPHVEILVSAATQINEPDSLYGIIQSHKVSCSYTTKLSSGLIFI